jgi:hypothetical protein
MKCIIKRGYGTKQQGEGMSVCRDTGKKTIRRPTHAHNSDCARRATQRYSALAICCITVVWRLSQVKLLDELQLDIQGQSKTGHLCRANQARACLLCGTRSSDFTKDLTVEYTSRLRTNF